MSAIIKKFEVQGFKSFSERTKIVFHPGITAFVGPNGTGKSNLVDAMLWVMGGLRIKSLRGDRTEDVIFNGNAKKPPLGMADAVLSLADGDEELTVSHRVFRSGESEYRLNGKTVRLRDIQDELWKHSIGEREYFFIEQGAIGNFVTSKPNEKRALIEEAAGTAYYKDKKRQAQSKLESTELNLTRLEDIIIEVERAKNSLQRQAQAANRYRRLRERIRELTSQHYRRKLTQLEAAQRHTVALYDACVSREQETASRVRNEEKTMSGKRKELWDQETALKGSQERLFGLKSQIARLESDIERESKRLEFFDEKKKRSEADRDELLEDVLHLTKEIEETKAVLNEYTETLEKRRSESERAEGALKGGKEATAREDKAVTDLREAYLLAIQETTETRNETAALEKEIELLGRQEEKLSAQAGEATRQLEENSKKAEELEKAVTTHSSQREAAARKLRTIKGALAEIQAARAEVRARLDRLKVERDEAAYHLQALKKIEATKREATKTRDIPGGLGLLADLIRTTSENASLLDSFLREDSRAQVVPAEEFLKNIPEGIQGIYVLVPPLARPAVPDDILNSPEFIGLLRSRFEPDEKIQGRLFYFENAVIVSGVREAVRLWIRHPGVNYLTSAGDLLLSSGLLRLGQPAEGMIALAAGIRELEKTVARLDSEIAPLAAELGEKAREEVLTQSSHEHEKHLLGQEDKALEDKQRELRFIGAERDKLRTTESILAGELENLKSDREALAESLSKASDALLERESRVQTLREQVDVRARTLTESLNGASVLEREYHEKRAEYDILREKMNGLRRQIEGLEKRKAADEAKITSLADDAVRSEDEKGQLGKNIRNFREKSGILDREKSGLESKLSAAEAEHQAARQGLEDFELRLQKVREEEARAKDDRMKFEIRKAEIERDIINLEEMCWQELKKTIPELRAEWEAQAKGPAGEDAEEPDLEENGETAEEEPGEKAAEPSGPRDEETEAAAQAGLPGLSRPRRTARKWTPVSSMTDEEIERELEDTRENLNRYKAVNLMAEEEFVEKKTRHDFLTQQRQDLRDSIASTQEAIHKIDEESKVQFLKAVGEVNTNFLELFTTLFKGGNAEVKLLEPENPLESGVEIVAQPPGKRVQNLSLLSGGEKSLTSLAFLFALFRYKPSPFCFLDEVDAALDDVNLARFLELLKNIKHQTQFILVTHNYKTMEVADYIYGTTMEEPNITKLYSVKFEKRDGAQDA